MGTKSKNRNKPNPPAAASTTGRAAKQGDTDATTTGAGADGITGEKPRPAAASKQELGESGLAKDQIQDEVADIEKLEDLPPGSSVDFRANEVVIHIAIAGGARRTFQGATAREALARLNEFAENGPDLIKVPQTDEERKQFEKSLKEADKQALERAKAEDKRKRDLAAD